MSLLSAHAYRLTVLIVTMVVFLLFFHTLSATAFLYSEGGYGNCQYNSCSITISLESGGSLDIPITPGPDGRCSVRKEGVTVVTHSDRGFTLLLNDLDANTNLMNGAQFISASSANATQPASLAMNTWGYRVDGLGSFGAGPTTVSSSVVSLSGSFAGIPSSSSVADTLKTTSVSTGIGVSTDVWHGVCVSADRPAGRYTDAVMYSAVTN